MATIFAEISLARKKNTRRVLALNGLMMIVEINVGLKLHPMALHADGWHMATHVSAFVITVGAYASAIVLGGIALFMAGH